MASYFWPDLVVPLPGMYKLCCKLSGKHSNLQAAVCCGIKNCNRLVISMACITLGFIIADSLHAARIIPGTFES
jgi:hypothetical protein